MKSRFTRRDFLAGTAGAAACAMLPRAARAQANTDRPNIIFFLIDDQRNDTLGCAGHPFVKTPVVDGLAAAGVRFRNAFVTTSICAASRATLLTGLYERTHGYTFGKPPISRRHALASYPALLRKAGYRTGFIGKFGVNLEKPAGGDARGKTTDEMFDSFSAFSGPGFKKQADGTMRHTSEICGDQAETFIQAGQDQPFCLSVSFTAVHAVDRDKTPGMGHYPWPKAMDGMYDDIEMPPPRLGDPAIFDAHPEFLKQSMNRDRFFWRWDAPEKYQANMRAYFRMLSGVDRVIGRIRRALEKNGQAGNTILIYMGDNGYYMGDRGFAGKWSHYEQSLRVPLIVYDPRLPQAQRGKVHDAISLNVDVPATILELAGVDVPAHYQGRSLVPLLRGAAVDGWRDDFFCEHLMERKEIPKWEGVRGKRYVYARYFEQQPAYEFLHDLQTDPDQLKNLVSDAGHAKILAKMRARCDELRDEYARAQ